jgi:hypothetical protein
MSEEVTFSKGNGQAPLRRTEGKLALKSASAVSRCPTDFAAILAPPPARACMTTTIIDDVSTMTMRVEWQLGL